ncbi:MAG TPA: DUF2600 family protein [Solirubrobacteraceae bacterium]|nr:DUF2600 family protein [Solirubrobacteraceae bacterium]
MLALRHTKGLKRARHGAGSVRRRGGPLQALLLANARYWPTVAPSVRSELARWQRATTEIDDAHLRDLAQAKLADECFNAEVAATLATRAPARMRSRATRAIVALEVQFDYLDGRTEPAIDDPIAGRDKLFETFVGALAPDVPGSHAPAPTGGGGDSDRSYLQALSATTREQFGALPAAQTVAPFAYEAVRRCAEAQTHLHAAATLGDRELERWARQAAQGSELEWQTYLAGGASSVLAAHALIAAAADAGTTAADAQALDRAYVAIGAVITILDSLVDRRADLASGEPGFVRLLDEDERGVEQMLRALIAEALARVREAPQADHHAMTLAGVAAYYMTHPGARDTRALASAVRRELAPTIWPAFAVMRGWRAAKSVRALIESSAKRFPTAPGQCPGA